MEMAKLTSKGQMTVPKRVRDKLELETGDNLVFFEVKKGYVIFNEKIIEGGEIQLDMNNIIGRS